MPRIVRFMHIRARIDPWMLVVTGFMLRLDDGKRTWIQCRYERVHKLCTRCGMIGHARNRCSQKMEDIKMSLYQQRGFACNNSTKCSTGLMLWSPTSQMISEHILIGEDAGQLRYVLVLQLSISIIHATQLTCQTTFLPKHRTIMLILAQPT